MSYAGSGYQQSPTCKQHNYLVQHSPRKNSDICNASPLLLSLNGGS